MYDVHIIFGSKSDSAVYEPILEEFLQNGLKTYLSIASAHRTPELLKELLRIESKLIVSGAGLSAALPGMIAAHSLKPVFGVPVKANFNGLDAVLSIAQMPPGIPVLLANRISAKDIRAFLDAKEINIVDIAKNEKVLLKAKNTFEKFGVDYTESRSLKENAINIRLVPLSEIIASKENLCIDVPVASNASAKDALLYLEAKNYLVGLNRGENAALACIRFLALHNQELKAKLEDYMAKQKEKTIKSCEEERGRLIKWDQ